MDSRLGWRVNEFLLLGIILFQVLDFVKLLSPFWDYVKKIVSWALIGYLLYRMAPSGLFFGERRRWWDAAFILACFALALKTIIRFAAVAREAMLSRVLSYATFVPGGNASAAVASIPLKEASLNAFSLLGGYLPNASAYAKPFAAQLTLTNTAVPFALTAGNRSVGALLRPYGPDGIILQLYNTLVLHGAAIERWSFIIGACLLILLGLFAAVRYRARKPSVLSVLHEDGATGIGGAVVRLLAILLVMAAFFTLLFNLAAEWLAIAVDAPLMMTGIAAYLLIAVRFHRRYHRGLATEDLISRVGNFGNNFIKGFGRLFTDWRTVPLGLSGLLVLHLLVDVGNFVVPYITSRKDVIYFGQLGAGHAPLPALIAAGWTADLGASLARLLLYLLNTAGILFLLILPAYIWYKAFRMATRPEGEHESAHYPRLPAWLTALGISSIAAFLLAPAFSVRSISSSGLVGVDLQTQAIAAAPLWLVLLLALLFAAALLLCRSERRRIWLMAPLFVASILFFGLYILKFFLSSVAYHVREGILLFRTAGPADLFIGLWILTFLAINLLFYVFGFFSFVYELVRD